VSPLQQHPDVRLEKSASLLAAAAVKLRWYHGSNPFVLKDGRDFLLKLAGLLAAAQNDVLNHQKRRKP
jgi:hypothetical protein